MFEYTPEMNAILNTLHKRIFNLEMSLQATAHSSLISNEKQDDQTSIDEIDLSDFSLREGKSKHNLTQMKTHAYEYAVIFEDAFDQLNIIYKTLPSNRNNNQFQFDDIDSTDCNPLALNRDGIFPMKEHDKLRYEIEYFFHILMLLFRALLLDSQTDFRDSVNNTHHQLPSIQLEDLNDRLKVSQEKISKLSFIKRHFHSEKFQQINSLNSIKSELKTHLMEEKSRSKIAFRYCNDWKTNHILQWIQMLLQLEGNYTKTIHEYENSLKQTEFSHQETIKYLIKQNNEIKLNVNKWYEYYQNETSRFESELMNFRHEFNQIKQQKYDMYKEYERMKLIVEEHNQMKIQENLNLEKQKQEEQAIKRLQAWWRGTMIRQIKQKRRRK